MFPAVADLFLLAALSAPCLFVVCALQSFCGGKRKVPGSY